MLQDTNNPELLREIDEAVARYREEKLLAADDGDEPELEEPEDTDDLSEPEQLTGRVPRIHRPPVRYNPSIGATTHCVLELSYEDSLYFESELNVELEVLRVELSDLDSSLL